MGVHGLTSLLHSSGLLSSPPARRTVAAGGGGVDRDPSDDDDDGRNDGPWQPPPPPSPPPPPPPVTLAVDGSGLSFRVVRNAHARLCSRAMAAARSAKNGTVDDGGNGIVAVDGGAAAKNATATALLPTMLPLRDVDREVDELLSRLLLPDGGENIERVDLYFDGPNQPMKAAELRKRRLQREEEWENLRQFCVSGALPPGLGCDGLMIGDGAKKKTRRKRGGKGRRRQHAARAAAAAAAPSDTQPREGATDGAVEVEAGRALSELYLSSFPLSRLSLLQVRASLRRWARSHPSCLRIIDCEGEADADVAMTSADDASGRTLAVGQDSDYLIYGRDDETDEAMATVMGAGAGAGEVRYLPFDALESCLLRGRDIAEDKRNNTDDPRLAALGRSDVAAALGLPDAASMVELSVALGNDYTGPYLRHDDKRRRRAYRESLRWAAPSVGGRQGGADVEDGDGGGEGEGGDDADDGWSGVDWSDVRSVVERVASGGGGRRLTSADRDLRAAVEYSRALYGFRGDKAADFLPADWVVGRAADKEGDDDDPLYAGIGKAAPKLPAEVDLSLAETAEEGGGSGGDIREAALRPLERYVAEVATRTSSADGGARSSVKLEERHFAAFRTVLNEADSFQREGAAPPTAEKLDWDDVRAAYVIERCVAAALRSSQDGSPGDGAAEKEPEPRHLFDMAAYHAALDALTYDDFPLDNEVAAQGERSFLDEFIENSAAAEVATEKERDEAAAETAEGVTPAAAGGARQSLPIDDHEAEILEAVRTRRVTIVHGETGCGKSSRVPAMLLRAPLPEPTPAAHEVKMFVSQPRRIAAKSLAERVRSTEPDLRPKIALRMGHGVREYESSETRVWFVTTGYLVRLLANHPESFSSHTHLIVDEVHERSVDTDVLCLLCRRLLSSHPTLRLVLMSATMAAELYAQYFGSPEPPVHVGARRFPIREYFVEDLAEALHLGPKDARAARDVHKECEDRKCRAPPSKPHMDKLYRLATQITLSVGRHGSSVLIFVPGMADIESITERIEELNVPGVAYTCLAIHSDVPFEEQMAAFDPPGPGEVKVIIATNAAESSVTLPDVDHVICLGLCKQIVYDPSSHRQMLAPRWISRASATQRAGRTGRVREGNVYRLYSHEAYDRHMDPFEAGEMVRIPLDSVILSLREMLNEEVTPVLLGCLEPPDLGNIERSFRSLHESKFISEPNDGGVITSLGSLVVSLGVDLTLGALVGLGIQFGVAPEVIQMAAILSFPKSPWLMTNPLYHEAAQFNEITSKTFVSRCQFDAGLYSEPLAIMNLLYEYSHSTKKEQFCRKFSVSAHRLRQLANTVRSLCRRVAMKLDVSLDSLSLEHPPKRMCHAKLIVLRALQLWVFSDSVITHAPGKAKQRPSAPYSIALDGPEIAEAHLGQVLCRERHPYNLLSRKKITHTGKFAPVGDRECDWNSFRTHFMSFATESGFSVAWYCLGNSLQLFISSKLWQQCESLQRVVLGLFGGAEGETVVLQRLTTSSRRGRKGRACGAWYVQGGGKTSNGEEMIELLSYSVALKKKRLKEMKKILDVTAMDTAEVVKHLSCTIASPPNQKKNPLTSFVIVVAGQCEEVPRVDICDLFSTPEVSYRVAVNPSRQVITFDAVDHDAGKRASCNMATSGSAGMKCGTKEPRPLLEDIPEGVRLLSVLASERRREHFIRFVDKSREGSDKGAEGVLEEEPFIDVDLPNKETKISRRWRRMGAAGGAVYVSENCVPAAAMSTTGSMELFACCANTLEVKGGGVRVEGMTLLPPGRIFTALAFLSFGCTPFISSEMSLDEEKKVDLAQDVLAWIQQGNKMCIDEENRLGVDEIASRISLAMEFNDSCYDLGEELVCHPDKVSALCKIFDQIDGSVVEPWGSLHITSTQGNNAKRRSKRTLHAALGSKESCVESSSPAVNTDDRIESSVKELSKLTLAPDGRGEPNTEAKKRRYSCLSCSQTWSKWSKCEKHMKKCCPELVLPYGQVELMEMCASVADYREESGKVKKPINPAVNSNAVVESCAKTLSQSTLEAGGGKESNKKVSTKYFCLSCAQQWSKWSECESHLRMCCPELVLSHGRVELMEKCTLVIDDREKSCKVKMDRKYRCLSCAQLWNKWGKCKEHMRDCCPENAGQDDLMRKCTIIRAKIPEEKRRKKKRYRCPSCAVAYSKRSKCLNHMQSCCPQQLESKKGLNFPQRLKSKIDLQQRCMFGHAMCAVPGTKGETSEKALQGNGPIEIKAVSL